MPNIRKHHEPSVPIIVRLDATLVNECKILLCGANGRVRHGAWTKAVEWALKEWLKSQKVAPP